MSLCEHLCQQLLGIKYENKYNLSRTDILPLKGTVTCFFRENSEVEAARRVSKISLSPLKLKLNWALISNKQLLPSTLINLKDSFYSFCMIKVPLGI